MIDYKEYLTYDKIEKSLLELNEKYPEMMRLSILCETEEGRKVYLAEIYTLNKRIETLTNEILQKEQYRHSDHRIKKLSFSESFLFYSVS